MSYWPLQGHWYQIKCIIIMSIKNCSLKIWRNLRNMESHTKNKPKCMPYAALLNSCFLLLHSIPQTKFPSPHAWNCWVVFVFRFRVLISIVLIVKKCRWPPKIRQWYEVKTDFVLRWAFDWLIRYLIMLYNMWFLLITILNVNIGFQ